MRMSRDHIKGEMMYVLANDKKRCNIEEGKDFLRRNGIRVKEIKAVRDLAEIEKETMVLVGGSEDYIRQNAALLREKHLLFDYAGNWFSETIDAHMLTVMGCSEYIDLWDNHVILPKVLPAKIEICRASKDRVVVAEKNMVRLGMIRDVRNCLRCYLGGKGGYIKIGDKCTVRSLEIEISTKGRVVIGDDVMFSIGIIIFQHDGHLIFDLHTRERLNHSKNVQIGNHVWVGRECMLLGGAAIPDNCVLGARSVTSGKFEEKNCVLAGAPARVVRREILWARDTTLDNFMNYAQCRDQEGLKYL